MFFTSPMIFPSLNLIQRALVDGLRRFPLVVLAGLFGAAAMIALNHTDSDSVEKLCSRAAFAAAFALPLLVAAGYAGELFPRGRWIFAAGTLLAVWAHWHFLDPEKDGLTFLLVWIAAAGLASAVPGFVSEPKSNWWRVNIGGLNALVLAAILTLVVMVGLLLATHSLQALFDLVIPKISQDVMAVCGFLIGPLAVVMLLPTARAELDARLPGFAVWGRLCQWALVPIGFLFTAILAAYAVRIVVERNLPDGMVALPVLALGCYGLAALWLLEPWRGEKGWSKAFARSFPVAFPLFSVLLFLALARRIEDYGFTWPRYAALALAIWIVACCLVVLVRRTAAPAFAPALLAAFALVAAFGPLSSQEVCLRSQTRHLEQLLADRSADSESRIASSVRYLAYNYDRTVLERFTGPLDLKEDAPKYDIAQAARKKLGLPNINYDGSVTLEFNWPEERPLIVEGYRVVHGIRCRAVPLGKTASGESLEIRRKDSELAAYAGSKKLHAFDLSGIHPDAPAKADQPPGFPWEFEGREFRIVVLNAQWHEKSESESELISADIVVLEK